MFLVIVGGRTLDSRCIASCRAYEPVTTRRKIHKKIPRRVSRKIATVGHVCSLMMVLVFLKPGTI